MLLKKLFHLFFQKLHKIEIYNSHLLFQYNQEGKWENNSHQINSNNLLISTPDTVGNENFYVGIHEIKRSMIYYY